MADEKVERINQFLSEHGASVDTIPKARYAQLEKVDAAIQTRLTAITKAQEMLRGNPINISVIASDAGIARKTIYNNDLLRQYIEQYSIPEEKTVAVSELERLKSKCDELERQVRLFLLRDIETENLRQENLSLRTEVHNLQVRNDALEEQNEKFLRENSMLKKPPAGETIPFPKKSKK